MFFPHIKFMYVIHKKTFLGDDLPHKMQLNYQYVYICFTAESTDKQWVVCSDFIPIEC